MNLEVEAKFQFNDLAALRRRLLAAGGVLKKERVFEKNTVYDDQQQSLKNNRQLIRLRQDETVKLTFKGPPPAGFESEAKVREEIELEVSDFDKMEQIIGHLGYQPAIVYEKYRETVMLNKVEVVLDELPYGNFIELEGDEAAIKMVADRLDINWDNRINSNYLALFEKTKLAYNLTFSDLTFANFAGLEIEWGKITN
ncbi:MAG: class IV adenylate cyclase [Anaerolineae bacterium]